MKNEENQMDFLGHIVNLEDAQNVELPTDKKTLSDNELEKAGLVKTSAFVRSNRSKNALRVEKNKEKKADIGIKQLNVEVPEQHRETVKAISKSLAAGLSMEDAVNTALNKPLGVKKPSESKQKQREGDKTVLADEYVDIGNKCALIASEGGFKALLLKFII
jgi:hypothetical protein